MSSEDDPEARIRDLERSLSEQSSELTQSSYEQGSGAYGPGRGNAPPPPAHQVPPHPYGAQQAPYGVPPTPYGVAFPQVTLGSTGGSGRGWMVFAVMGAVTLAIIVGTVVFFANVFSSVNSIIDTFDGKPTASGGGGPFGVPPSGGNRPPAPTSAPSQTAPAPGTDISVAGVGSNRSITCDDNVVNVSGVNNTLVLTGQCRSVTVSGIENTVTVDSTATISASGFNNRITFLSGSPEIQNSGDSNVVERG
jgi:Protein of unknown function (DUF3060)